MKVGVATREGRVTEIRYLPPSAPRVDARNALAAEAARQIEAYKVHPDFSFDLPIVVEGNEVQKAVWRAMCAIPRGKTRTYGQLGHELSARFPEANPRVVGQACGDNRLPIIIPCHRVVAANGIGGFAHSTGGYLLEAKRWLLAHECGADTFELTP